MDFNAWLKAHGFDPGRLAPAIRSSLQAAWQAEHKDKQGIAPASRQSLQQTDICTYGAVDPLGNPVDLGSLVDKWVRLSDGVCYRVHVDNECVDPIDEVTVVETFDDCRLCVSATCYELTECDTEAAVVTAVNFSEYELGTVFSRAPEQGGGCWELTSKSTACDAPELFTVASGPFQDCEECQEAPQTCTQLVKCGTEGGEPQYIWTTDSLPSFSVGDVLKRQEDGQYWKIVTFGSANCENLSSATVEAGPLASCPLYELQLCDDEMTSIVVTPQDLTNPQVGSVHKDDQDQCWIVVDDEATGTPVAFDEVASYPPGDDPCEACSEPPVGECCATPSNGNIGLEPVNGQIGDEQEFTG